MLKRTNASAGTHKDLLLSDMDKNVRISHISKAPAIVMVLGIVASDRKCCPIISVTNGDLSGPTPAKFVALAPCYICILVEIKFFIMMVCSCLPPFPFEVSEGQYDHVQGVQ
jgi:hypothetical protein